MRRANNIRSVFMAGGQTYSGRFRVPVLSKTEWAELDGQLSTILAPWHQHLASATSHNISNINDSIVEDIRAFLITKPDLFLENQKTSNAGFCSRESRSLNTSATYGVAWAKKPIALELHQKPAESGERASEPSVT